MALRDAVIRAGLVPPDTAEQSQKKRYSELLSHHLAIEVADGLRSLGFADINIFDVFCRNDRNRFG